MTLTSSPSTSNPSTSNPSTSDPGTTSDDVALGPALDHATARHRARWPLYAIAAGVFAVPGNLLSLGGALPEDEPDLDAYVTGLDRGKYHAAFVLLLASAACLLLFVSSLRRWAAERAGDRPAARVIPTALSVTATLAVIAAAMAGSLALYLPGGMDDGVMWTDGLKASYLYLDFGALFGWWGAMLAAGASATLSFGQARILPRWFGVVSAVLVAFPLAVAVITALPGLPGLFMPIWLIVFGIVLLRRRG
jgi:hypothetical protein